MGLDVQLLPEVFEGDIPYPGQRNHIFQSPGFQVFNFFHEPVQFRLLLTGERSLVFLFFL